MINNLRCAVFLMNGNAFLLVLGGKLLRFCFALVVEMVDGLDPLAVDDPRIYLPVVSSQRHSVVYSAVSGTYDASFSLRNILAFILAKLLLRHYISTAQLDT